jgi:hypothetical protein
MANPDFLDTKQNILYCSMACAIADGSREDDLEEFTTQDYFEAWNEQEGLLYGALCPHCENEYHGYQAT